MWPVSFLSYYTLSRSLIFPVLLPVCVIFFTSLLKRLYAYSICCSFGDLDPSASFTWKYIVSHINIEVNYLLYSILSGIQVLFLIMKTKRDTDKMMVAEMKYLLMQIESKVPHKD